MTSFPNRLSLLMGSRGVAAGANPNLVSGRDKGWTSRQLIAGPSLMSKVRFSISLKDTSTCSSAQPEPGFEQVTFRSVVDLLYLPSYSIQYPITGYTKPDINLLIKSGLAG